MRKPGTRKPKTARRAGRPARSMRTRKPTAIEALVAASGQVLALPIDPALRTGVSFNLQLLFEHAALVDEFSLPDQTEPAPVFRA